MLLAAKAERTINTAVWAEGLSLELQHGATCSKWAGQIKYRSAPWAVCGAVDAHRGLSIKTKPSMRAVNSEVREQPALTGPKPQAPTDAREASANKGPTLWPDEQVSGEHKRCARGANRCPVHTHLSLKVKVVGGLVVRRTSLRMNQHLS